MAQATSPASTSAACTEAQPQAASTKHAILPLPKAEAYRRRSVRVGMHVYIRIYVPCPNRRQTEA
jgi:hypothetical protein